VQVRLLRGETCDPAVFAPPALLPERLVGGRRDLPGSALPAAWLPLAAESTCSVRPSLRPQRALSTARAHLRAPPPRRRRRRHPQAWS
jgi:hypothetical protein